MTHLNIALKQYIEKLIAELETMERDIATLNQLPIAWSLSTGSVEESAILLGYKASLQLFEQKKIELAQAKDELEQITPLDR